MSSRIEPSSPGHARPAPETGPVRIAMWSGPRNISTAMMRSFGARADCAVTDEPLYAHYLRETGYDHPMRDEILAEQCDDWREVAGALTGAVPGGRSVWYQKHMTHHLLDGVERDWLDGFQHAFLIREPRAMLVSLLAKLGKATIEETGLPQQVALFRWLTERTGRAPVVVDAADVQRDPRGTLSGLCSAVGIAFDESMLSWEPGRRDTDGCWGDHWYANTYRSTEFLPYVERDVQVPAEYEDIAARCGALYEELGQHRIHAGTTHA